MNWNNIISGHRTGGTTGPKESRTDYQRDFDRLVFSSAFRRLQDKTQIFPLPGSTFVHNRLTHSLEVASVGRSLGKLIGNKLVEAGSVDEDQQDFYLHELSNVIASACLAHDIGNPAFGHSGEDAISSYFVDHAHTEIEGNKKLREYFSGNQWHDLIRFEGNANSFRILTHQFNGKSTGGYRLTYPVLAAILKYPCESVSVDKNHVHRKKFSFFQSEKELGAEILRNLNIDEVEDGTGFFKRHPFVYLTEAADDICYRIVDFEDAQRLHILSFELVYEMFLNLIHEISHPKNDLKRIKSTLESIGDPNEQISYLRAIAINSLTLETTDLFMQRKEEIISGAYNKGLLDELTEKYQTLQEIQDISINRIYNHDTVVELEITGYRVMSDLLGLFIPAILKSKRLMKDKKVLRLLPDQFKKDDPKPYAQVFSVLDYLSGMTDSYAIELYRKLFGIEISKHA